MRAALQTLTLSFALLSPCLLAATGDRQRPYNVEAESGGEVNTRTGRIEFSGNVLLTQGSLQLRSRRIELLKRDDDSYHAISQGAPGEPVRFEQASDRPNERITATAERVEYDSRDQTARFIGGAVFRRWVGGVVADEMSGAQIAYNSRSEILSLAPGQTSPQAGGRVRLTSMPRNNLPAPAAPSASSVPLQTAPALSPKPQPGKE